MEHSKEDKSPFDLSEHGPPALSDGLSKTRKEKREDRTNITHGTMSWNPLVSPTNCGRPRNWRAYHSEDKECSLVCLDVYSKGGDRSGRDTINPHPNRQDGEKRCQL